MVKRQWISLLLYLMAAVVMSLFPLLAFSQASGAEAIYRGTPGGPYVAKAGGIPLIKQAPKKLAERVSQQKVYPLKLASAKIKEDVTRFAIQYRIEVQPVLGGHKFVDDGYDFRTGDRFRIHLQSNFQGYVYVLLNDPEGSWKWLIPSPQLPVGQNFITPEGAVLPYSTRERRNWFQMQVEEGLERLYVFVSPLPIPEIDEALAAERSAGSLADSLDLGSFPDAERLERPPGAATRFRTIGIVADEPADVVADLKSSDVLLYEKLQETSYLALLSLRPDAILRWKLILKHTHR